ncbi:MAG: hypothetical protein KDJ29_12365 [Hyphomicrobiales bacterium]|nr:hypothetical protein [Hyphomicrobiales bacterium]
MLGELFAAYVSLHGLSLPPAPVGPVIYYRAARATSNWRWQAAVHLDLQPETALAFSTGLHPSRLPRCIRLNNYWCIKRAGWIGEVAADGEGHVAFSSSLEGATVAARLLRRYYVDYKRTSALAIISRWAPAECGVIARRGTRRSLSRSLARRGIHRTLRARFLARHGRGGLARKANRANRANKGKPVRIARSRVRSRPMAMMRAPSISPGMGEIALPSMRLASLAPLPPARLRRERAIPRIGCTSEAIRIRNYAGRISSGIAENSKADLKLFLPDGTPGPNLARVMARMAAVEIGPYTVDRSLIAKAIAEAEELRDRMAAKAGP